jgi:hypothetical protein
MSGPLNPLLCKSIETYRIAFSGEVQAVVR